MPSLPKRLESFSGKGDQIFVSSSPCNYLTPGASPVRTGKVWGPAYPIQSALVHRLGVLLQLVLFSLDVGTLDVSGQVRHVGDPGHCPLGGWHGGVQRGWRLRMLGQGEVGVERKGGRRQGAFRGECCQRR